MTKKELASRIFEITNEHSENWYIKNNSLKELEELLTELELQKTEKKLAKELNPQGLTIGGGIFG